MKNNQDNLKEVQKTNKQLIEYFNDLFVLGLEEIQALKTQFFEVDVKVDELKKTKDLYIYKAHSRKSVFSPAPSDTLEEERGRIIDEQVNDLLSVRETLQTKIKLKESELNQNKARIDALKASMELIDETLSSINEDEEIGGFEFIEEDVNVGEHGYNILMQDAFEKTLISTLLERNIKDGLSNLQHKLDMLSYLLGTDIGRAKLNLKEIIHNANDLSLSIETIEDKLDGFLDNGDPIYDQLDEFIMTARDNHPSFIIEAEIDCSDDKMKLHPVFTINLFKMLNIFLENTYKHSDATSISFKILVSPNIIEVILSDNGVGITQDKIDAAPWYSGIHKAQEIIFLLDGKLAISGDISNGTKVNFSFPISS